MTRFMASLLSTLIGLQMAPVAVFAQTTGSGATDQSSSLSSEDAARIENFRVLWLQGQKKELQYRERRATYLRKRAENRQKCRSDIRSANRDTRMPTILRCYRAELSLQREFLLQEKEYITAAPGITATVRTQAVNYTTMLTDAINTIIFAIDNNVYVKEEDVMEARKNLRDLYRAPQWNALTMLRADRMLTWIVYIQEGMKTTGSDAMNCLSTQKTDLMKFLADASSADKNLTTIEQGINGCLETAKETMKSASGSGL